MAWWPLSPEVIVKRFKRCCISSGMDGTDNDMLWNGCEEYENVRSECEEGEGADSDTDW